MSHPRLVAAIALCAVAAIGTASGIAAASGSDDGEVEQAITGDALAQASDAALAHTGQGSVTETEVGDEEGYYEVEVTLDDGSEVDVHLDADFNVLGSESEGADEDEVDDEDEVVDD